MPRHSVHWIAWSSVAALPLALGCGQGAAPNDPPSIPTSGGAAGSSGGATAGNGGGASGTASTSGGVAGAGANGGEGASAGSGASGAAGTAGSSAGSGAGAGAGGTGGESADALAALRAYLALARATRPPLEDQPFSRVPLVQGDALQARELLWNDHAVGVREARSGEVDGKRITLGDFTLRYETVELGSEPAGGRSLFISMHGGGAAPAATNDQQWQNQIALGSDYDPEDALWIAPRAPTDDWNMWFKDHVDGLFDRLITNMIVFEGINPNRVYLTGYSAGGDGVYQLGPRMADRWAAAAMSAGHPNSASPLNLRNIGFAIHVGGDDTAFMRNTVALEWGADLDALRDADPAGYPHQVEVHAGLPHWMNLADGVSIPFVQGFERDPAPPRVVWRQPEVPGQRLYWLAVDIADAETGDLVIAGYANQTVAIESATGVSQVTIRLSDDMLDLDASVRVEQGQTVLFEGAVTRTIATLHRTLLEREDPEAMFPAELAVELVE
jgi:hypothetical protein